MTRRYLVEILLLVAGISLCGIAFCDAAARGQAWLAGVLFAAVICQIVALTLGGDTEENVITLPAHLTPRRFEVPLGTTVDEAAGPVRTANNSPAFEVRGQAARDLQAGSPSGSLE